MHPNMRDGWVKPTAPEGYSILTVCDYGEIQDDPELPRYELDFFSRHLASYLSEEQVVKIDYPWIDGFEPTKADWEQLGFEVHDFR